MQNSSLVGSSSLAHVLDSVASVARTMRRTSKQPLSAEPITVGTTTYHDGASSDPTAKTPKTAPPSPMLETNVSTMSDRLPTSSSSSHDVAAPESNTLVEM